MLEREAVLFANDAFYEAFRATDAAAMDRLWARSTPVVCIHPGWQALHGREDVMQSWQAIFDGGATPTDIQCRGARVLPMGKEGAVVLCYEQIGQAVLVATNLFVKEEGEWRLIHHHAGPCELRPENLGDEPPPPPMQ